jgi:hypothetical protein
LSSFVLSEHSRRAHLGRTSRRCSSHLSSAASSEVNYPTGTGVRTGSAKNDDDHNEQQHDQQFGYLV